MTSDRQLLVYGVVSAAAGLPSDIADRVTATEHGDLAVLTGPVADGSGPVAADLVEYTHVLDAVAAHTAVLPVRFDTIVDDEATAAWEVLEPHHDEYVALLDEIGHAAQFTLRASYVDDAVLRDLLDEDPEVRRLSEASRDEAGGNPYGQKVALGERIVARLAEKRAEDSSMLVDAVSASAQAVNVYEPSRPEDVVDVALLVDRNDESKLEAAAESAGRQLSGRVRMRLLGPQAPYDFVPRG